MLRDLPLIIGLFLCFATLIQSGRSRYFQTQISQEPLIHALIIALQETTELQHSIIDMFEQQPASLKTYHHNNFIKWEVKHYEPGTFSNIRHLRRIQDFKFENLRSLLLVRGNVDPMKGWF